MTQVETAIRAAAGPPPGSYDPDRLPEAARRDYDDLLARCPIVDGAPDPYGLTPADQVHVLMLIYAAGDSTCRTFLRELQPQFSAWLVMRYGK
jgi:hypothetical protein